ncbi:MAG: hypothetical protein M3N21_01675 [Actinomycetota bacterium]|nr:hypothetical protein [Actinomycetota bacterium]
MTATPPRSRSWLAALLTTAALAAGCAPAEHLLAFGAQAQDAPQTLLAPDRAAAASCRGRLSTERGVPPPGLPLLPGSSTQAPGQVYGTAIYTSFLPGTTADLPANRDRLLEGLRGRGFTVTRGEAAQGTVALSFAGPLAGSVAVQPLCRGHLVVRYQLSPGAAGPPTLLAASVAAETSCRAVDLEQVGTGRPPGLPLPEGATALRPGTETGSVVYTAFLVGLPTSAPALLGSLAQTLRSGHFTVEQDRSQPMSATLTFAGPRGGRLLVQPLCRSLLAIRYFLPVAAAFDLPDPRQAAAAPCSGRLLVDAAGSPPSDFPLPSGATPLQPGVAGDAELFTVFLRGTTDTIVALRGGLASRMRSAGFVVGTDPATPFLASASFDGPRTGHLVVQPLCSGIVAVRWTIVDLPEDVPVDQAGARSCAGLLTVRSAPDRLPATFALPGLTVTGERRSGTSTLFYGFLRGVPASVGQTAADAASTLRAGGVGVGILAQSAHEVRLSLTSAASRAELLIRPLCEGDVLLRYDVRP